MNTESAGGKAARVAAGLMVASALAFGVSACGDDDDDSSGDDAATTEETAATEEVTITATEYDFELSATPTADTKTLTFDNQGKKFHVMIYAKINEGFTVAEAIELSGEEGSAETLAEGEAPPGKSVTFDVKKEAEPGSYAMLCPIEDKAGAHYELGQLEEFEIE